MILKNGMIFYGQQSDVLRNSSADNTWLTSLVDISGQNITKLTYGAVDNGTSFYGNPAEYLSSYVKTAKSSWLAMTSYVTDSKSIPYGIVFGSGNEPVTYEDYTLSGDVVMDYTASYTISDDFSGDRGTRTVIYTLTNSGTEAITIGEIAQLGGIYQSRRYSSSSYNYYYIYNNVLLARSALETPITIEPGGVGQITYSLSYIIPTA